MADDDFHEWIALDDPRPLSGWERAISLRFLDYDFADKEIVRSQLEGVLVVERCRADPTIQLSVPRDRPKLWKGDGELMWGALPVSLETTRTHPLGYIHALVHVREGMIAELEFFRVGGDAIDGLPPPEDFVVVPD